MCAPPRLPDATLVSRASRRVSSLFHWHFCESFPASVHVGPISVNELDQRCSWSTLSADPGRIELGGYGKLDHRPKVTSNGFALRRLPLRQFVRSRTRGVLYAVPSGHRAGATVAVPQSFARD